MGHVLSFPVLCLANELVLQWSYHKFNENRYFEVVNDLDPIDLFYGRLPSNSFYEPVPNHLVNGDDILFACSPEMYDFWRLETAEVGLIPSLGKNLFSPEICQINSVLYSLRFSGEMGFEYIRSIENVPYLSMGIITGRGKGKDEGYSRVGIDECMENLDELTRELPSLDSNFRNFEYSRSYVNIDDVKTIFFSFRPKLYEFYTRCKIQNYSLSSLSTSLEVLPRMLNSWSELYLVTLQERELNWLRFLRGSKRLFDVSDNLKCLESIEYLNCM
jgi:hypothetical protein